VREARVVVATKRGRAEAACWGPDDLVRLWRGADELLVFSS